MKSERELLRENLERFRTKNPHKTADPAKRSSKFKNLSEEFKLQQSNAAPYFFEMKWTGDCRGSFFKGNNSWENNDLLEGLAMVRTLGDKDWFEDTYADKGFSGMSVEEVIDWLESDVIGMGEEAYAEILVNGVTIFEDPLGLWMYDNLRDGEYWEKYEQKVEQKFGADAWNNNWGKWFPERLEKLKKS